MYWSDGYVCWQTEPVLYRRSILKYKVFRWSGGQWSGGQWSGGQWSGGGGQLVVLTPSVSRILRQQS